MPIRAPHALYSPHRVLPLHPPANAQLGLQTLAPTQRFGQTERVIAVAETPIPVIIVDSDPADWLVDFWVPLLGALASITVAIAAIVITVRLARSEHRER